MTASGLTLNYQLPYPLQTDGVDVASDMESLATAIDTTLLGKAPINSPTFTGTPSATTANPNTNTTQIATTQFVVNQASSVTPLMNSVAATGTSLKYSREDHVHPSDTATVIASRGGTGQTSYAIGDVLYASGSVTLAKLSSVATGNSLISGGVGAAPSWGKIGLTTHVSGTLPVANGGTGVTSSTGSGSTVLSSNPTISSATMSSPIITGGTITSANLISVTGTQTLNSYRVRNIYVSTTDPGTGNEGDIWLKY